MRNSILSIAKDIYKTQKEVFRANRFLYWMIWILSIISGLLPILNSFFWMQLVNNFVSANNSKIYIIVICMGICSCAVMLLQGGISNLTKLQSEYFNKYYNNNLLTTIERIDYEYFENHEIYNNIEIVTNQSSFRIILIYQAVIQMVVNICLLFVSMGIIFSLSPILNIMILGVSTPSFIYKIFLSKVYYKFYEEEVENIRYVNLLKSFSIQYINLKEIKVYNELKFLLNKINSIYIEYISKLKKHIVKYIKCDGQASMIQLVVSLLIKCYMIYKIISKGLPLSNIIFFIQIYNMSEDAISGILLKIADVFDNNLYVKKYFEFIEKYNTVVEVEETHIQEECLISIELKNIYFRYPSYEERKILDDINISFERGKSYAIVGKNGCGKSTLVKVLLGLYKPVSGTVFYNNKDIAYIDKKFYHGKFSIIFQDFVRYPLSMRDNIIISNHEETKSESKLKDVMEVSGVSEFVDNLSDGIETNLMKQWRKGIDLSVGQWQKVAIARALYRNTEILVMDEPTASLDAFAEKDIFDKVGQICRQTNKTTILISHRLSSVQNVDVILFMENGKIVEQGTHRELFDLKGKYFEMYKVQADSYK